MRRVERKSSISSHLKLSFVAFSNCTFCGFDVHIWKRNIFLPVEQLPHAQLLQLLFGQLGNVGILPSFD